MPKVKTSRTISGRSKKNKPQSLLVLPNFRLPNLASFQKPTFSRQVWLGVILVGLLVLLYYKKNLFIAAWVNGSPITSFQVMQQLNDQYGSQVLNQMINEKVILDEAKRKGVNIPDSEVNNRISTLEKNVGGAQVLDNLLTQQGQTRQGLKDQIKIQLSVEKLYASETTSSAQEIQDFIDQNKDKLTATDSAGQQKEAESLLKQQKLSTVFNEKFQSLKQQANIQIF